MPPRRPSVAPDVQVEKSAIDLVAFLFTAFVLLIAFTCIFHFTLGTYLPEFATLPHAFFTVILGLSSVWEPMHWCGADASEHPNTPRMRARTSLMAEPA
mgnify:CR=1 FL=1